MSGTDVVDRVVAAFNGRDATALAAVYATNAVINDPMYPEPLKGRSEIEEDFANFVGAFPDVRITIRNALAGGDTVAGEFTMVGTHEGPLPGPEGDIPATGKSVTVSGAVFVQTNAEGEIVDERRYYDLAGLMAQLGLVP